MNKKYMKWVEPQKAVEDRINIKKQMYGYYWPLYLLFYPIFGSVVFGVGFGIAVYFIRDIKLAVFIAKVVFGIMFIVLLSLQLSSIFHRKIIKLKDAKILYSVFPFEYKKIEYKELECFSIIESMESGAKILFLFLKSRSGHHSFFLANDCVEEEIIEWFRHEEIPYYTVLPA